MNILTALKEGVSKVNSSKRMVVFAWLVGVTITLVAALPMLKQLEDAIGPTVFEEKLLEQIDVNWAQTFRANNESNSLARSLDVSIFDSAPFFRHANQFVRGEAISDVGTFLTDLIFRFTVNTKVVDAVFFLSIIYLLASTFLAGGFVGIFSKEYQCTFTEFLTEGAKYFGRFFRLSLVALVVSMILFLIIFDPITQGIPRWTENDPSEMTPFVYYMIRNGLVVILFGLLLMSLDYAKARIVVDERASAILAFIAGVKFAFRHFRYTAPLYLLLAAIGLVFILIYSLLQSVFPETGYWTILLVFIVGQCYMLARVWLRATYYGSQTLLYKGIREKEFEAIAAKAGSS